MTGCATGTRGRKRGLSTCCLCTSMGEWNTPLMESCGWTHRYGSPAQGHTAVEREGYPECGPLFVIT